MLTFWTEKIFIIEVDTQEFSISEEFSKTCGQTAPWSPLIKKETTHGRKNPPVLSPINSPQQNCGGAIVCVGFLNQGLLKRLIVYCKKNE
jgi:hypothetical protein